MRVTANERSKYLHKLMLAQLKEIVPETHELEYRFHPERRWRFDIAYPAIKVAIEIHGGVYAQGRHTRGKGFTNDREKMNEAHGLGWKVFEFTTQDVENGKAAHAFERYYKKTSKSENTLRINDEERDSLLRVINASGALELQSNHTINLARVEAGLSKLKEG